jgi:hypothetical protein
LVEDRARRVDHPVGGLANARRVAVRPGRDVGGAVGLGRGDAERGDDDVGDAFGFDLGLAAAAAVVEPDRGSCRWTWASSWTRETRVCAPLRSVSRTIRRVVKSVKASRPCASSRAIVNPRSSAYVVKARRVPSGASPVSGTG